MVNELINLLCVKNNISNIGNKTLFINTIRNNNFFTEKGRYPKSVGAEKIIAIP
jgi:hypothetical protein